MPCANCARTSAVAGATSSASIDCATAMCSMAESMFAACSSPGENIPVITFSPESAAKVSGRTNSWAARVMMTCTRMPRSCKRRTISAALYANAARHSQSNFHDFQPLGLRRCYLRSPSGMPKDMPSYESRLFQRLLGVRPEGLIQNVGGLLGRAASFGDLPFHFTRADLVLCNAARFAGVGLDHRRRSGLQLPRAPCGDQNVAIVAVEAFDQFHGFSPLGTGMQD